MPIRLQDAKSAKKIVSKESFAERPMHRSDSINHAIQYKIDPSFKVNGLFLLV